MPIIFILANYVARLHIEFLGSPLYFSVLLYPLTYLTSGLIIRKTDYKDALKIMAVSLISASLACVLEWALFDAMNAYVMIYAFLSFLICQLIFIYSYDFLIKINKDGYFAVLLLVLIVSALDNAFFGIMIEGQYISLSILVRLLYVVFLPAVLAKKTRKETKDKK